MKLKLFPFVISTLISLLIAYFFYIINSGKPVLDIIIAYSLSAFIISFCTLCFTFSIEYESSRLGVNIKLISFIFFIISILSNFLLSFFSFAIHWLVIIVGMQLLIFLLLIYYINKTQQ